MKHIQNHFYMQCFPTGGSQTAATLQILDGVVCVCVCVLQCLKVTSDISVFHFPLVTKYFGLLKSTAFLSLSPFCCI
jgi:hypothetical protein